MTDLFKEAAAVSNKIGQIIADLFETEPLSFCNFKNIFSELLCSYFYICFQAKRNCVVVCHDQDAAAAGNVSPAQMHSGQVFQFSESHTLEVGQESHMQNVLVCRLFCCLFFFSPLFHVVSFIYLASYLFLFLFCCFLGGEGDCSDCSKWVEIYPVNVPVHE